MYHKNDAIIYFELSAADGTNIDVTTGKDATVKQQTSVIKIKRDQVDEGKNVWFTSYQGNSTLFDSDSTFPIDGQIIGAGKHVNSLGIFDRKFAFVEPRRSFKEDSRH